MLDEEAYLNKKVRLLNKEGVVQRFISKTNKFRVKFIDDSVLKLSRKQLDILLNASSAFTKATVQYASIDYRRMVLLLESSGLDVSTVSSGDMLKNVQGLRDHSEETLIIGDIDFVERALRLLKKEKPQQLDYPNELKPWFNRNIFQTTMWNIRCQGPVFVKPVYDNKLFTGKVLNDGGYDAPIWATTRPSTKVWCSSLVEFISEYRYFVLFGQICGHRHYAGKMKEPDLEEVQNAVKAFESGGSAPCAYTIDFGLLDDGRSTLVEVNDGYSFGAYGLSLRTHLDMLIYRWFELINT